MVDEFLGYLLKNVRGLGFAASVFVTTIVWVLTASDFAEEARITVVIWTGAVCFHWLGGFLDHPIYDRLFSTGGFFSNVVDTSRERARAKLGRTTAGENNLNWKTQKLYKTCEIVFERSEKWEKRVELPLELSKAARTLFLPLLILWILELAGTPVPNRLSTSWLGNSSTVGLLVLFSLLLYLVLRVIHNRALYNLVGSAEANIPAPGIMTIETLPGHPEDGGVAYRFSCQQVGGDQPVV